MRGIDLNLTAAEVAAGVARLREHEAAQYVDGVYWGVMDPEQFSWMLWWCHWGAIEDAIRCVRPLVLLVEAEAAVRKEPA